MSMRRRIGSPYSSLPARRAASSLYRARRRQNARLRALARASGSGGARLGRNRVALLNQRTGGLLGIEKKFLDCGLNATALTAPAAATGGEIPPGSGCTGCLSAPGQGDTSSQREGNKIVVQSCLVQGIIEVPAQAAQSAADLSCDVFIALVQDTQTNGTQLNSEDVFTNPAGQTRLATSLNRNMSYTQRFKVLKMKKMNLRIPSIANDTGATGGLVQFGFHRSFKLSWKGLMPVTFLTGTTTADIANVSNNSLQIVAFCSNTTLAPTISYTSRIRFVG